MNDVLWRDNDSFLETQYSNEEFRIDIFCECVTVFVLTMDESLYRSVDGFCSARMKVCYRRVHELWRTEINVQPQYRDFNFTNILIIGVIQNTSGLNAIS